MNVFYRRFEHRKYEIIPEYNFLGFPSDGIWIVSDNGYSFMMKKENYSPIKTSFMLYREQLIKLSGITKINLVNLFSIPVEEKSTERKMCDSYDIFIKKNNRYKKYGELFSGFPHSGIFEVYDGKNNGITFLGHFSDFPKINADILATIKIPEIGYNGKSNMEYATEFLLELANSYTKLEESSCIM